MSWSPTCTLPNREGSARTRTRWLDPTSSAPCSATTQSAKTVAAFIKGNATTVELANVAAFPPVTQPVQRRSGSNMTQVARQCGEEKTAAAATPLIGYSASGVFDCVLSIERDSAGTRCCMSLAGSSGHRGRKGEQVRAEAPAQRPTRGAHQRQLRGLRFPGGAAAPEDVAMSEMGLRRSLDVLGCVNNISLSTQCERRRAVLLPP